MHSRPLAGLIALAAAAEGEADEDGYGPVETWGDPSLCPGPPGGGDTPRGQTSRGGVSHGCHTFGDGGDAQSLERSVPSRPPCTSLLTLFPTSPGPLSHLSRSPFPPLWTPPSVSLLPQAQPPLLGISPKGSPVASGVSFRPLGAGGAGKRHKASPCPVPAEIIKPIKSTQTETRRKAAVGAPLPLPREQLCSPGAALTCPARLPPSCLPGGGLGEDILGWWWWWGHLKAVMS